MLLCSDEGGVAVLVLLASSLALAPIIIMPRLALFLALALFHILALFLFSFPPPFLRAIICETCQFAGHVWADDGYLLLIL